MDKLLYEYRPYAFLLFSVWALANAGGSKPGALSAFVLFSVSIYILYIRFENRGKFFIK